MSEEEATVSVVGAYYVYLNRAPDPEGLAYWVKDMQNGMSVAKLNECFKASDEYNAKWEA